jgi:dipeptidyl aminopeptidase/acylaminoacyl peptidase
MDKDIRETTLYRDVEDHFRRALEPAFGRISGAADPAPSPDGSLIAFTGSRLDRLEGPATGTTRICVASVDERSVEEVTAGPNDDRLPRWSPDGSRLAFLSDRANKGRFDLFFLAAGRIGEAVAGPKVDGTVEFHVWAPDGSRILLGVAGLGADKAGAQGSGTTAERDRGVPAWLPDVESAEGAEAAWRRLWMADLDAGSAAPLSREGLNVWEADWCGPDAIAAIVSESPGEETWYAAPLVVIDAATGRERILYRSNVQLGMPRPSPDGRRIAVVEALCSDRLIVAGDLLLVDPSDGSVTRVDTAGVDVTDLAWRDDRQLVFFGLRGLQTVAGEMDVESGTTEELWASAETCGDWYPAGQPISVEGIAVVLESFERPPEVAVIREGKAESVASFEHRGSRYLQEIGGRIEEVLWTGPDGLEVQGLLLSPERPGPHALVVYVHGGPVWAYRSVWAMGRGLAPLLVSRGYAVLFPNPRGSGGRGQDFVAHVVGDMGGKDAEDILAGVEAMVERGVADPDRIGVTGGSYGGFMACWLPTRTTRFAASVAVSPVSDWYSQHYNSNIGHWDADFLRSDPGAPGGGYFERSPVMFAAKVKTPVLLTAGLLDKCTPPGQAVEFYRAVRGAGGEAEVAIYPGEGHGVRNFPGVIDLAARTVGWFEHHMPATPD